MARATPSVSAGRNDLCPCGSGRKYKRCHGPTTKALSPLQRALLLLVVVALAGMLVLAFNSATSTDTTGKVWSAEHGHYH
jgi:hypothetical protein